MGGVIKRIKRAVKKVRQNIDWLRDPSAGGRTHLPPFLSSKGRTFASTWQAFAITVFHKYLFGAISWAWGKITAVPSFLLSPLVDFHSSTDYRWRTLVSSALLTIVGVVVWMLKQVLTIAKTILNHIRK